MDYIELKNFEEIKKSQPDNCSEFYGIPEMELRKLCEIGCHKIIDHRELTGSVLIESDLYIPIWMIKKTVL